jgi:hypothetical protein
MNKSRILMTAAAMVVGGLLSALASTRQVSMQAARDFAANYTSLGGETRSIFLSAEAVGSLSIDNSLLDKSAVQPHGPIGALLERRERKLPRRVLAVAKPRVWVFCKSTVAGPFLIVTDLDAAWELQDATHQAIQRSLRLAFASQSVELSSWKTGAMYHHPRR